MANTYVDYTATAAQVDSSDPAYGFLFAFPYLEDSHVVVEVDGVVLSSSNYTIQTTPDKRVKPTSGVTAGQVVRVKRDSNADGSNPFVDFTNGSVLTEDELDKSYLHNLYLNEEIGELNQASLQKAVGGTQWDAKNLRILNVADPTGLQDAATKTYTDGQISANVHGLGAAPVKQTFTGDASETEFTFSSDITLGDDTAYEVAIDGVLQEPTVAYAINAETNKITFTSPPPNTSKVVIIPRGHTQPIGAGSTVAGNVAVTGNVTSVDVTASGDVSVGDDLTVTDDASVGGNLEVTGELSIGPNPTGGSVVPFTLGRLIVAANATGTKGSIAVQNAGNNGTNASPVTIPLIEAFDNAGLGPAGLYTVNTYTNNKGNGLEFKTTNTSDATATRMTIHKDGNVGIGTTTPTVPLDVTGNAAVSGTLTVGGLAGVTLLGKYASGWGTSHGSVTVANGSTHTLTHSLGTTDVQVKIYVSTASGGTNPQEVTGISTGGGSTWGAVVTDLAANTCTVQLGQHGYLDVNSSGSASEVSFASKYINVVVIG